MELQGKTHPEPTNPLVHEPMLCLLSRVKNMRQSRNNNATTRNATTNLQNRVEQSEWHCKQEHVPNWKGASDPPIDRHKTCQFE